MVKTQRDFVALRLWGNFAGSQVPLPFLNLKISSFTPIKLLGSSGFYYVSDNSFSIDRSFWGIFSSSILFYTASASYLFFSNSSLADLNYEVKFSSLIDSNSSFLEFLEPDRDLLEDLDIDRDLLEVLELDEVLEFDRDLPVIKKPWVFACLIGPSLTFSWFIWE